MTTGYPFVGAVLYFRLGEPVAGARKKNAGKAVVGMNAAPKARQAARVRTTRLMHDVSDGLFEGGFADFEVKVRTEFEEMNESVAAGRE